jgi:hypothetical protein
MEARHKRGESLDVHSVRQLLRLAVDTEVDKRLKAIGGHDELMGRPAWPTPAPAYMRFKEIFYGARFAELREAGAKVQRPLWASTGVKNPAYSPTMYVDGLVAPDTVNTMPMDTLLAAAKGADDHRRHRRPGPHGGPGRPWPPRDRHGGRSPSSSSTTASPPSSRRWRSCWPAWSPSARRSSRAARPRSSRPSRRPGARDRQAHRPGRRGAHRQAHLGQGRHGLGPRGPGRGRQPARLADHRLAPGRRGRRPAGPSPPA